MTFLGEQKVLNFNIVKYISLLLYSPFLISCLKIFFSPRDLRYFLYFFPKSFKVLLLHLCPWLIWIDIWPWSEVEFIRIFFHVDNSLFLAPFIEQSLVSFTDQIFHFCPNPKFHIFMGLVIIFLMYPLINLSICVSICTVLIIIVL